MFSWKKYWKNLSSISLKEICLPHYQPRGTKVQVYFFSESPLEYSQDQMPKGNHGQLWPTYRNIMQFWLEGKPGKEICEQSKLEFLDH